ncbi:STAS domain-containing protein [Novosphingobium subterraneum]|uniref:STAS domain-containing protein n=1 Tax=Novosphingobium subterraneum TaxID=48936 RepID=UPI001B80538A|nr:STAS domain-containing protein [Novosphingobium subterraneum]
MERDGSHVMAGADKRLDRILEVPSRTAHDHTWLTKFLRQWLPERKLLPSNNNYIAENVKRADRKPSVMSSAGTGGGNMTIPIGTIANLSTAPDIREAILDELKIHSSIEIDCSSVVEADLTFLQILAAARKFAQRESKSISIVPAADPAVAGLIERAGLAGPISAICENLCATGATEQ